MNRIVKIIIISLLFFIVSSSFVYADKYGLKETADAASLVTAGTVPQFVGKIVGNVLSLVAIMFFILMIYAGFKWMVSRGNDEDAKKSLNTIIGAVIGLAVIFGAYTITDFIFGSIEDNSTPATVVSQTTPATTNCPPTSLTSSDITVCNGKNINDSCVGSTGVTGTTCQLRDDGSGVQACICIVSP
ncbi:MAG: pilin [Candidatus Magasanikiibacteriota bacterium]